MVFISQVVSRISSINSRFLENDFMVIGFGECLVSPLDPIFIAEADTEVANQMAQEAVFSGPPWQQWNWKLL